MGMIASPGGAPRAGRESSDVRSQGQSNATNVRRLKLVSDRGAGTQATDFFFYGEPEFIAALSDALSGCGFALRPALHGTGVVATFGVSTEAGALARTAHWLASLAGDLGVAFDGWTAADGRATH